MDRDEEQRQRLMEEYEALPADEKRRRVILEPAFRDAYNEITRPDRITVVPQYFWEKWVPVLGPVASMLYMRLRQYCYHNPKTGESRIECWPKQETLAREIGVGQRQTVARNLELLEEKGFIKREPVYYKQARGDGAVKRGSDKYLVFFEVPLVPEDAADLLSRQTTPKKEDGGYKFENRTDTPAAVENPGYMFEKRTHSAVRKTNSRTSTRIVTNNVDNVLLDNKLEEEPTEAEAIAPSPPKLEITEKASSLAVEVGDTLLSMEGARNLDEHKSAGFHRVVCAKMPEKLVRQALMATRDALDSRNLRGRPSAYFAGVAKQLAADIGIDLGLKTQTDTEHPFKGNQAGYRTRSARPEGRSRSEDEKSAQEAREAVKALREKWAEE